jgi:hypothetical protein
LFRYIYHIDHFQELGDGIFYALYRTYLTKKVSSLFGECLSQWLRFLRNLIPKQAEESVLSGAGFPPASGVCLCIREGRSWEAPLARLEEVTGAPYAPHVTFDSSASEQAVRKKVAKALRRGLFSEKERWLGAYYASSIAHPPFPPVSLQWVSEQIGWGVFAEKPIRPHSFIGLYAGVIHKYRRRDRKNSYCFECLIAPGVGCNYTIDAKNQGGITRYVNHSSQKPNLYCALALHGGLTYVLLCASRLIEPGEELLYDYGPAYWKDRDDLFE